MLRAWRIGLLPAITVVLAAAPAVQAVVETIDATVTSFVKETIVTETGTVVNSDYAFEDLDESTGETTPQLPLIAEAQIVPGDREAGMVGLAAGVAAKTVFNDPRLSTTSDPDEFGIAVGALSLENDVVHYGRSHSTETREITFLRREIQAGNGTALEARSWFFLDGILVLWAEQGSEALADTRAEVAVTVRQTRPSDPRETEPTTVLEAGAALTGLPGGGADFSTSGVLSDRQLDWWDLSDLVPELGLVHLVLIPNIAIPYEYPAVVGETFILYADIEATIHDQAHTGAAVLLGFPLEELIELINGLSEEDLGDRLSGALWDVRASVPARPLPPEAGDTKVTVVGPARLAPWAPAACGGMGVESALLLALFAATISLSPRRR